VITYFDTSVFVPLFVEEPTSGECRELWFSSQRRASTRLLFVEASAGLERVAREGRLSRSGVDAAIRELSNLWRGIEMVELDENLMLGASALAGRFGLRGYDAVHCAAALEISDNDLVAATADSKLNAAWSDLGLAVFTPDMIDPT